MLQTMVISDTSRSDLPDTYEANPWEFDTVRGPHSSDTASPESHDEEQTPIERSTRTQPPPSLRGLFEQSAPPDEFFSQPLRKIAIPTFSPSDTILTPRVEIPDMMDSGESTPFFDSSNMQTARPDDFPFARRNHEPSGSSSKTNYRDGGRGADNMSNRAPSQAGNYTDPDRDLSTHSRPTYADDSSRNSSPQHNRREGGSPGNFTFPQAPPSRSSPLSNSSPTQKSSDHPPSIQTHTPRISSEEGHASFLGAPPSLARSQSAAPYVPPDNTGFVRPPPPRPQPSRQQSSSALEPPVRPRPFRSGSTSTQEGPSGSTLAVPKTSALREALKVGIYVYSWTCSYPSL
jgi:hypothetical protein